MGKFLKALTQAIHNVKVNEKMVTMNGGKMSPSTEIKCLKLNLNQR